MNSPMSMEFFLLDGVDGDAELAAPFGIAPEIKSNSSVIG
jgi:hypothetical protein